MISLLAIFSKNLHQNLQIFKNWKFYCIFNRLMNDFEEYGTGYVFAEFMMCVLIVGSVGIIMITVCVFLPSI